MWLYVVNIRSIKNRHPVFIIGTPRSGTTLTAKILGRHSNIFMPGETHFFDDVYSVVFGAGSRNLGDRLWQLGDVKFIDGLLVNGSAKFVGWFAGVSRCLQTGMLYHYAFAMIIGVLMLFVLGLFI